MYLSLDWVKDFVELPKSINYQDLGRNLTLHTVEVDGIEDQSLKFNKIIIGKIKEITAHPNANRLRIAKVDVGEKKLLQIVCGAPNIEAGQYVPIASVGAILPNGLKIQKCKIRDIESNGMMCSEKELGFGDDHSGIMILKSNAKLGSNFSDYIKFNDIIFEIDNKSITNRPDLWGHYGLAREIAAFSNLKFRKLNNNFAKKISSNKKNKKSQLEINIQDKSKCSRYIAVQIDNLVIEKSPQWLQNRLLAIGIKPINNIVDITNYIMFDLGQPMHAFDASKIADTKKNKKEIIIRLAKTSEILETLDKQKRKLTKNDLVIADSKKAIALAGIMGGANSEVDQNTKSIILEIANFEAINVRMTSKRLNLRTEASNRYEKNLDPNLCELALDRVLDLIKKIIPQSKISSPIYDENHYKEKKIVFNLSKNWIDQKIGKNIPEKEIKKILSSLDFDVLVQKKGKDMFFKINVPSFRATKDISIKEDIIEEIARIYGYENIDAQMPQITMKRQIPNLELIFIKNLRNILSNRAHLNEVYNYSFNGTEQLKKLNINAENYIKIANPVNNNQDLLRQSLIPNLLSNIKTNQVEYPQINIFEIGSVFLNFDGQYPKDNKKNSGYVPHQEKFLGICISDRNNKNISLELKKILRYLDLNIEYIPIAKSNIFDKNTKTAQIVINNKEVGFLSIINNQIKKNLGIKHEVAVAEFFIEKLLEVYLQKGDNQYSGIGKFPEATRDLAFVIDQNILFGDFQREIKKFHKLIKSVSLFDIYTGDKIEGDKKSLAFNITYQSEEKTLEAKEIDDLQKKLIKKLKDKFGAILRDF